MSAIHKFHPSILTQLTPQDFFKQHTTCSCHQYLDFQKGETGRPSHNWNSGHGPLSQAKIPTLPPRLDLPPTSGKTDKKETFCSGWEVCLHLYLGTNYFWQAHPSTLFHFQFHLKFEADPSSKTSWPLFQPFKGIFLNRFGQGHGWQTYLGVSAHNCR
jgi:hypothetical protein